MLNILNDGKHQVADGQNYQQLKKMAEELPLIAQKLTSFTKMYLVNLTE